MKTQENRPNRPDRANRLENLVPDLELCRQIPEGAFDYSALVWADSFSDRLYVSSRDDADAFAKYPAPTLAEIMAELPKYNENEVTLACVPSFLPGDKGRIFGEAWSVGYTAKSNITDANPVTAALKLWLRLNVENGQGKDGEE